MKSLTKPSKLLKMLRYCSLKETQTCYEQRSDVLDNQCKKKLPKARKSSKIGPDQKILVFAFV